MTEQVDLDALIAEAQSFVETTAVDFYENQLVEALVAELRQERERADEASHAAGRHKSDAALYEAALSRAEETIDRFRTLEPLWHRGMYGCPQDMYGENQIRAILTEYSKQKERTGQPTNHEIIRCDYCGDALPSVKSRAHIPTTPNLQRLGFDASKVVCPECVERVRSTDTTNHERSET